jgi:hypothetical protein
MLIKADLSNSNIYNINESKTLYTQDSQYIYVKFLTDSIRVNIYSFRTSACPWQKVFLHFLWFFFWLNF